MDAKYVKKASYPFDEFKVSKFSIKTEKRATSKDNIKLIMNLDLTNQSEYIQFSKDLFIFSYLCGGMNFTDIANLKSNNIVEGRLIYIRQKTSKKINLLLSDEANAIIDKYSAECESSGFIFPILNNKFHKTETQKYNRRKKVLLKVNKSLKEIANIGDLDVDLTTYCARQYYH